VCAKKEFTREDECVTVVCCWRKDGISNLLEKESGCNKKINEFLGGLKIKIRLLTIKKIQKSPALIREYCFKTTHIKE
jgi:hypothetical protein